MIPPPIIVFDGYDGSGKTTLARLLAERLLGRYVKVFQGDVGALVGWLYQTQRFTAADVVARVAIAHVCDQNRDASCLIFDRHWLTMFALLPEKYYAHWGKLPKTFLCCTDAETTLRRLAAKGENLRAGDDLDEWCARYRQLAERFGATILDTTHSTPQETLALVLADLI